MKNLLRLTILFVLLFSLSACGSSQTEANPAAVIEAADAAWNAKDADALLALYTDDAIDINGRGIYYGEAELRSLFEAMVGEFTIDCGNYLVVVRKVYYDCVLIVASDGRHVGERYTAVIVNGKIKANIRTEQFAPPKEFKIDSSVK